MEKLSASQLAFVFSGIFFGAGFVSGQELLSFFGVFGWFGVVFLNLTIIMFVTFTGIVLYVVQKTGIHNYSKIVISKEITWLRNFLNAISVFFLFVCVVVMIAACGSLFSQLTGLPPFTGSLLFCILLTLIAIFGKKGLVNTFNIVTPFLVAVCVAVFVFAMIKLPYENVETRFFYGGNPLIGNVFLSSLTYLSYNMLPSISMIVALSDSIGDVTEKKSGTLKGLIMGGLFLDVIAMCILLSLITHMPLSEKYDLPMLGLAAESNAILGSVYAILLFAGIFAASVGCLFAFLVQFEPLERLKGKSRYVVVIAIAFLCSLLGFKELVNTIYPVFGYIGIAALVGILLHFGKVRKNKEK